LFLRKPNEHPLAVAGVTIMAPLYCAVLPSFLLGIRFATGPVRNWPATWAVFFPLAVTWVCDTIAMWVGKSVKGPKLAPVVSPGKTRSGSVGGLVGGVLAAVIFNRVAMGPSGFSVTDAQAVIFGLVLSVAAQIGDLAESLFKREVGIKDSSGLIPGHGGVLDRFDSLYFVVPISAMLYRLLGLI
jgi:phosphatidate cytidylyltransferase